MNYKTFALASGTCVQFDHLHKYLFSAVIDVQYFVVSTVECRGEKDKDALRELAFY